MSLVDSIPSYATINNQGFFRTNGPSQDGIDAVNIYFLFDAKNDVVYFARDSGNQSQNMIYDYFINSQVYTVLRWPYVTKGAVDPDLEGVQEKMTGGMLPMLLLLLGCGIGLKLLDYGSIKLMRFWDDKDSQRALARINNLDDPLEHKVALEAHRKAYNARFKRYAKEDRQRRRR